ncbi:MAG: alkaline phosphatase family protein, partial [Candidatus Cybelea sp.]
LPPGPGPTGGGSVGKHIHHVVVIIQENRSFENFFSSYPGADAPSYGYAVIKGVRQKIALRAITFQGPDLRHDWYSSMDDWDNGKMDGFDDFGTKNPHNGPNPAYTHVERKLIAPYWAMAQQYVLADHMFPTEFGGSFTGHLTLIAGTDNLNPTKAEVNFPTETPDDCDSPPGTISGVVDLSRQVSETGPFPCFDQFKSIATTLDNAGVSWRIYATRVLDGGMWEPFEAIKYVRYGADWPKRVIAPQIRVLKDAKRGDLAAVTWVTPSREDSDHPAAHSDRGPSWVASVVNSIGESSAWKSTAIVVLWDDWGGWYDNAKPPQLDFRGLGIRVPCLIISPYAKQGFVSHTQYEYGSVLKFIEEAFELPALGPTSDGYTDTRAASISDSFDFNQAPRAFSPIPAKYPLSRFVTEPPSDEPVDTQ